MNHDLKMSENAYYRCCIQSVDTRSLQYGLTMVILASHWQYEFVTHFSVFVLQRFSDDLDRSSEARRMKAILISGTQIVGNIKPCSLDACNVELEWMPSYLICCIQYPYNPWRDKGRIFFFVLFINFCIIQKHEFLMVDGHPLPVMTLMALTCCITFVSTDVR